MATEVHGLCTYAHSVNLSNDIIVPAYSEQITSGTADLKSFGSRFGVVEPMPDGMNVSDVLVGSTLVDVSRTDIGIPVRLMNTSPEDILLRKGTKVAFMYAAADIGEIAGTENDEKE